ncbi:MAG TPA: transcriptional regulator [Porphyromonadaceae bacterium]|jgi:y4mF family transcriptional regulator|nr:transcriptional regulator [Porphyromonadaceae bacterium]HBL33540.1 transcriptional regulator [Porphyromonadaceae bacterium]HBX21789.1 transcriptional regulator [Porphyromonadaceae bacterium]HCM19779.1 transcriptional regulator [Porphyromonadaceae bacterium]
MEEFGNIIKERRKALSITQRELAALAGVGINTLTKIERGEANPSLKVVMRILDTLGLEIDIKIRSMNL